MTTPTAPHYLFLTTSTREPGHVGKTESHGCVRMANRDMVELFDRVPVGTPVLIRED